MSQPSLLHLPFGVQQRSATRYDYINLRHSVSNAEQTHFFDRCYVGSYRDVFRYRVAITWKTKAVFRRPIYYRKRVYGKIGSGRKVERTHRLPLVLRSLSGVAPFRVKFSDAMIFVWASEPSSDRKARWKGTVLRRLSGLASK